MPARRCSTCGISYPTSEPYECAVCDERTDYVQNIEADDDWKDQVERLKAADSSGYDPKIESWRAERLEDMGLDPARASHYAIARKDDPSDSGFVVDLERFRRLREAGATPDQALAILV